MKKLNRLCLVALSVLLFHCGGKEEKKKEGFTYEKTQAKSTPVEVNPNDVVITSNDAMRFNKKEIKVIAGKKVKLTLKHLGKMPKTVMGHNFVLLKKGIDVSSFGRIAAKAGANDYIPKDTKDVIAYTKLIGGGETTVIEFDAPAPGVYDFLCSFPGHYGLMKGKFVVE